MPAIRSAVLLLLTCCLSASAMAATFGRDFSVPEYTAELDHLSTLASEAAKKPSAANEAINELRGDWKVKNEGREFRIDTDWMIGQFVKLKSNSDSSVADGLIQRLNLLEYDAQEFQRPPSDSSSVHAQLNQILARPEFHQVHGPTWFDRLKYRILMWFVRILTRFFGASSAPTVGRILVWTLVAVAVLVTAFLVFKVIRQSARLESFIPEVVPVSAKSWHAWMEEAQGAATKGLWREAVHLAYWAGISFLEQSGMWKPDRARTPREYLRLLPAASESRTPLSNLTRTLELTWYGNQPAGPETFSETVSLLETLGCRQK
jgi:hypothetical protein